MGAVGVINNNVTFKNKDALLPIIKISGSSTKISKQEIINFVCFMCKDLMPRLCYSLYIEIELTQKLMKNENIFADVIPNDPDSRTPKDFIIRIDSCLNKEESLKSLAHELTHVKQYAKGELKEYWKSRNVHKWKKEIYENVKYEERPWENEAKENENIYYEKWLLINKKGHDVKQ